MDYEEFSSVVSRERELEMSAAFPVLMRKVYLWMTMALVQPTMWLPVRPC